MLDNNEERINMLDRLKRIADESPLMYAAEGPNAVAWEGEFIREVATWAFEEIAALPALASNVRESLARLRNAINDDSDLAPAVQVFEQTCRALRKANVERAELAARVQRLESICSHCGNPCPESGPGIAAFCGDPYNCVHGYESRERLRVRVNEFNRLFKDYAAFARDSGWSNLAGEMDKRREEIMTDFKSED